MKNMEVIISNSVREKISEYAEALLSYPIPLERALQKKNNMINALKNIGNNPTMNPICMYKDLGQVFNEEGKPINISLRRFNYKDKSGFQWAFSYVVTEENVVITKMMPSNQVRESKIHKMMVIKESQIRQIIRETIKRILLTA